MKLMHQSMYLLSRASKGDDESSQENDDKNLDYNSKSY